MLQISAATGSDEESKSTHSRAVDSLKKRTKDGSIPLLAGAIMLIRALRSSRGKGKSAGQLLAATALVGIGFRQRRHHKMRSSETEQGGWTGTSEQRADSHEGTNPRGTTNEPAIETEDEGDIQFNEDQTETTNPQEVSEDHSSGDPRVDEETTEVDLSEAALADEASEAAGPSSVQSQPTQTDSIEPEETPEEDSSPEDADVSDETEAEDEDPMAEDDGDLTEEDESETTS